jgi:hypothetical protein
MLKLGRHRLVEPVNVPCATQASGESDALKLENTTVFGDGLNVLDGVKRLAEVRAAHGELVEPLELLERALMSPTLNFEPFDILSAGS